MFLFFFALSFSAHVFPFSSPPKKEKKEENEREIRERKERKNKK
jgi:hypothetical protein